MPDDFCYNDCYNTIYIKYSGASIPSGFCKLGCQSLEVANFDVQQIKDNVFVNTSGNSMYAMYLANEGSTPVTIGENFCINSSCNTIPELDF